MEFLSFLLQKIKVLIDSSGVITKFIIGFGICLILCYFIYIDYFPTDLSLGDGLLFFLITIKFIFIYLLFIGAHYALGSIVVFLIEFFINSILFLFSLREKIAKIVINVFFEHITFKSIFNGLSGGFIKSILCIFGFLFVFVFYESKSINLLIMIMLSVLLVYCINKFIEIFKNKKVGGIDISEGDNDEKNTRLLIMLLYILFAPSSFYIFYAEKNNNFWVNTTLGTIREDNKNSIIFIKNGLKDFFPETSLGQQKGEYIELKKSEILLRGIGKNALVQYKAKTKNHQGNDIQIKVKVEIPNDSLLVVRRTYTR